VYKIVAKEDPTLSQSASRCVPPMWRAKLRPGRSSSFAHRAHQPCRALHQVGDTVLSTVGVRSMDLLFREERMQAVSDELIACTDDDSYGHEALVIALSMASLPCWAPVWRPSASNSAKPSAWTAMPG
jgi:hypothetical protein